MTMTVADVAADLARYQEWKRREHSALMYQLIRICHDLDDLREAMERKEQPTDND